MTRKSLATRNSAASFSGDMGESNKRLDFESLVHTKDANGLNPNLYIRTEGISPQVESLPAMQKALASMPRTTYDQKFKVT